MKRSAADVIHEIEKFLQGAGAAYDWDDFTSIPIRDPRLNAVRIECAELHENYPPMSCRAYCNDEGLARLRVILENLKKNN